MGLMGIKRYESYGLRSTVEETASPAFRETVEKKLGSPSRASHFLGTLGVVERGPCAQSNPALW